jgi:hypothetical protein
MKMSSVLIVVLLLLTCGSDGGCKSVANPAGSSAKANGLQSHIVTWTNYDGDSDRCQSAEYIVDGRSVGRGDAGFAQLMAMISSLPSQATVEFRWTDPYSPLGSGPIYAVPFYAQKKRLFDMAKSRGIILRFPPGLNWI